MTTYLSKETLEKYSCDLLKKLNSLTPELKVHPREEGAVLKEGINLTKTDAAWYVVTKFGNKITRIRLPVDSKEFIVSKEELEIETPEDKLSYQTQEVFYETKG